mgnify:CR=1 FL=1
MPLNLPQFTGQVPHDVEQAIRLLEQAVNQLQTEIEALRRMVTDLSGKRA